LIAAGNLFKKTADFVYCKLIAVCNILLGTWFLDVRAYCTALMQFFQMVINVWLYNRPSEIDVISIRLAPANIIYSRTYWTRKNL